jgi:hypothetical protein
MSQIAITADPFGSECPRATTPLIWASKAARTALFERQGLQLLATHTTTDERRLRISAVAEPGTFIYRTSE